MIPRLPMVGSRKPGAPKPFERRTRKSDCFRSPEHYLHMHCIHLFSFFTPRLVGCLWLMLGVAAGFAVGQQEMVSINSSSAVPGGAASLNISLSNLGGVTSTQLQWTMNYPPSAIVNVAATAGPAAASAGKSILCSGGSGSTTCIAFGVNQSVVPDGVLAVASFTVSSNPSTSAVAIQVTNVVASNGAGQNVYAVGSGGAIVVNSMPTATPTLTGLGCSPATVGSQQNSSCTVYLSSPAVSAVQVALASSTYLIKIPWAVTIPAGASSATFSFITGVVSYSQTAALTATLNSQNLNTLINLTPAVSLSGLFCTPTTVNSPGAAACVLTLSGPAGPGGVTASLTSSNLSAAVPPVVAIGPGTSSAAFTVTAAAVSSSQAATIAATLAGTTQAVTLNLLSGLQRITGSIAPFIYGSGTTVTLNGVQSVTADGYGYYAFDGLANGSYTVTPSKNGYSFSPPSQTVSVNGSNVTVGAFTAVPVSSYGTISTDVEVRQDQLKSNPNVTSPTFSTSAGNELLLAFVAAGYRMGGSNTSVNSVSGGGLAWTLVGRTQVQYGTAEVWRAFAPAPLSGAYVSANLSQAVTSSITVMSFAGVDSSGVNGSGAIGSIGQGTAPSGGPYAGLTTTRPNSLVIGVGNDPASATAMTPGPGQTVTHQDLDRVGTTYWVQMLNGPVAQSGTTVAINDVWPVNDPYNLTAVEILAAPDSATQSTRTLPFSVRVSSLVAATDAPASAPILSNLRGGEVIYACSPGGLASLLGSGMTTQGSQAAAAFPLPLQLAGVQVLVNGNAAPLLSASDTEIRFQCPLLAAGTPLNIVVAGPGGASQSAAASVMEPASPELLTVTVGNASAPPADAASEMNLLNRNSAPPPPAEAGQVLTLFATGLGDFTGSLPAGTAAPLGGGVSLQNPVRVFVAGTPVSPLLTQLAPGTVGLAEVRIRLPRAIMTGPAVPLYLEMVLPNGTVLNSNEVTIAVQ